MIDFKEELTRTMPTLTNTAPTYEIRTDTQQGTYVASDKPLQLEDRVLDLDCGKIYVGEHTTLCDWFTEPCRFMGFLQPNQAIFYLGKSDADLFSEGVYYYALIYIIAKDRIGTSYKAGTFRDVFLRNDNGKFCWK